MSCEQCKYMYDEVSPPCAKCFPGIHDFNIDVLELYNLVGDQYIMGSVGPVGLNLVAIGYAFDNLFDEVIGKRYFIERLKVLSNTVINKTQESNNDGKT